MKPREKLRVLCAVLLAAFGFFLQTRDGMLCWRAEDCAQWTQTGTPAASLMRERDRQALAAGIYCPDRQTLTRALEDYCA